MKRLFPQDNRFEQQSKKTREGFIYIDGSLIPSYDYLKAIPNNRFVEISTVDVTIQEQELVELIISQCYQKGLPLVLKNVLLNDGIFNLEWLDKNVGGRSNLINLL